jgi:hypothetical protein
MAKGDGGSVWAGSAVDGLQLPVAPDYKPAFNDDAGWQLLLHSDVFEWLTEPATEGALRKRVYFVLREMLVNGKSGRVKSVRGAGKGWLRSPLGGTGGFHYYLWWAPHSSSAVDGAGLDDRQILVRRVRHHDETHLGLDPGGPENWLPISLEEVFQPEGDSPFTEQQMAIATHGDKPVTLVKGTPGSGKTTALWLAGSFSNGPRSLYITYSRGLARTATDYFRAFGPEESPVTVLTFEDLLVDLAGAVPGSIDFMAPTSGAERLAEQLSDFRLKLGQWKDRWDELYAELHAHSVGRALPIPFREMGGTEGPILSTSNYLKTRKDVLSKAQAEIVDKVAQRLVESDAIERLFPGPSHARRLLLGAGEPPPASFAGVTSIMVDEVQDLTQVEAMFLLTLTLRIAVAEGKMPRLLIAGDEAQTVRPTDFKWDWLNDLTVAVLGRRLGAREPHALDANLRSPKLIASVIESSRLQYRRFDKELRPGGATAVQADDTTVGRVLYCRAREDQNWEDVAAFFAGTPSAQLVYPGHRLPSDLPVPRIDDDPVDIATSDQVKGLDFPVVGIVDAGRREQELIDIAAKADTQPVLSLWGRTLADQFHVAVSRSTETLVLLDRGVTDHTDTVRELCGADARAEMEEIDPDGLQQLVDEESDHVDLLLAQLERIRQVLDDDPERALRLAVSAHRMLERARSSDTVLNDIVQDTLRLRGVAAAIALERGGLNLDEQRRTHFRDEARRWLAEVDLGELYGVVARIQPSMLEQPASVDVGSHIREASRRHPDVTRQLPELLAPFEGLLLRWVKALPEADLPENETEILDLLDVLDELVAVLEAKHPELPEARNDIVGEQAARLAESEQFERALLLHRRLPTTDVDFIGACFGGMGEWRQASELFESSGRLDDALRCAREIPDIELALRLASTERPDVADRMRWANEFVVGLDPADLAHGEPISGAEHDHLAAHMAEALAAARVAVPGPSQWATRAESEPVPEDDHLRAASEDQVAGTPSPLEDAEPTVARIPEDVEIETIEFSGGKRSDCDEPGTRSRGSDRGAGPGRRARHHDRPVPRDLPRVGRSCTRRLLSASRGDGLQSPTTGGPLVRSPTRTRPAGRSSSDQAQRHR